MVSNTNYTRIQNKKVVRLKQKLIALTKRNRGEGPTAIILSPNAYLHNELRLVDLTQVIGSECILHRAKSNHWELSGPADIEPLLSADGRRCGNVEKCVGLSEGPVLFCHRFKNLQFERN